MARVARGTALLLSAQLVALRFVTVGGKNPELSDCSIEMSLCFNINYELFRNLVIRLVQDTIQFH